MSSSLVSHLSALYLEVAESIDESNPVLSDKEALPKVVDICQSIKNRALIRFLMSCLTAKIHHPEFDIRKPYTQIGGGDSFSGRHYDEHPVQEIITKYDLPCNSTTAYLTPAFRNGNSVMTPDLKLEGRPPQLYKYALELLDSVHKQNINPEDLLKEIFRQLILFKATNEKRIKQLVASLKTTQGALPLSSEQIVNLLRQHLASGNASRLPTLIVAAAYRSVGSMIGEFSKPLNAHNAADSQTGAFGDIEITLTNDENIRTCYEMKDKKVTKNDITVAIQKLARIENKLDNYIFITTDEIDPLVEEYARSLYNDIGIEFAILDCIGFINHFLHFFHRHRERFLNEYQALVLAEPNSSVGQPLKEVFLTLRQAAEIS